MVRTVIGWSLTFLLVGAAGAISWLASHAALPGWLVGPEAGYDIVHSFLFDFFGMPACAIVAAVAGFAVWRGFWLWWIAAALPVPVVDGFLSYRLIGQGVMEPSELWGATVFVVIVAAEIAVACTLSSALGAGLRVLAGRRWTGRPAGTASWHR